MTTTQKWFAAALESRLDEPAHEWFAASADRVASGIDDGNFASLLSLASRHAPRRPLAPDASELARAAELLPGWNPERWTTLEALRVALLLARRDLDSDGVVSAIETVFEFADDGEACAMYKSLAHLPDGARFAWRAAEGCRTNIVPVFESVACDTPYPAAYFDDIAFNQMCIKALFIEAPLWRVFGLDGRLSPELARMALDLADERRSAARPVQPELWLCLGEHGGERGLESIERELASAKTAASNAASSNTASSNTMGRRGAALALARAGERARLEELVAAAESRERREELRAALEGPTDQSAFRALSPREMRD